jgi:hypothetical protein
VVQIKLDNPGITKNELAKAVGVNGQTIAVWFRKLEFQQYENWVLHNLEPEQAAAVQERKDAIQTARTKYETYLDEMQDRLFSILETTESEKLQVDIIFDSMDRVGLVSKKDAPRATPIVMTGEAMAEFMRRAVECGITPPEAVDAEILNAPCTPLNGMLHPGDGGRNHGQTADNQPKAPHLPRYLTHPKDTEESA